MLSFFYCAEIIPTTTDKRFDRDFPPTGDQMIKLLGLVVVVTALPSPCGANAAAAVSANLKISIVSPISCDNGDPLAVPSMAAAAGLPLRAQRRFQQSRRRVRRYRQVYRWLRCDRHQDLPGLLRL